jgi:hypothetical protein
MEPPWNIDGQAQRSRSDPRPIQENGWGEILNEYEEAGRVKASKKVRRVANRDESDHPQRGYHQEHGDDPDFGS